LRSSFPFNSIELLRDREAVRERNRKLELALDQCTSELEDTNRMIKELLRAG